MKNHSLLWIVPMLALILTASLMGCLPAPKTAPTTTATNPQNSQPIEVISVSGPLAPINPGGPIVEIVLKNVGTDPVKSLTATIETGRSFKFTYDVSAANPLLPGKTTNQKQTLIGGGFSDTVLYPLTINGTLQSGVSFGYTKQIKITQPSN